jgi:hypothetical protein
MAGKCPRCQAVITSAPDGEGVVTCSGCGLKLRSLAASVAPPPSGLQALLEEVRHLSSSSTSSMHASDRHAR